MNERYGLGGSMPQFNRSGRSPGQLPLYHSYVEQALILDGTILPGFGVLKQGTVMAVAGEYLVPYTPTVMGATDLSRAFLTAGVTAAKDLFVTNAVASRFKVGQVVAVADSDDTYTDAGAVTAIVLDSTPGIAKITVTNNVTATVAKQANLYHKAGAAGKFSDAFCIIDQSVDTGSGVYPVPVGALVSYVVSNAVLYTNALIGMDAAAITALGAVVRGQYTILK